MDLHGAINPIALGQAIGIARIFMGLAIFAVDQFSGDHSEGYHKKIEAESDNK